MQACVYIAPYNYNRALGKLAREWEKLPKDSIATKYFNFFAFKLINGWWIREDCSRKQFKMIKFSL